MQLLNKPEGCIFFFEYGRAFDCTDMRDKYSLDSAAFAYIY